MAIVAERLLNTVGNQKGVRLPCNSLLIASVLVLRAMLLAHVPVTAMTAIAAENVAHATGALREDEHTGFAPYHDDEDDQDVAGRYWEVNSGTRYDGISHGSISHNSTVSTREDDMYPFMTSRRSPIGLGETRTSFALNTSKRNLMKGVREQYCSFNLHT